MLQRETMEFILERIHREWQMLENIKKPGWLGEVLDGATTIWENREGNLSQNRYSPGGEYSSQNSTAGWAD